MEWSVLYGLGVEWNGVEWSGIVVVVVERVPAIHLQPRRWVDWLYVCVLKELLTIQKLENETIGRWEGKYLLAHYTY